MLNHTNYNIVYKHRNRFQIKILKLKVFWTFTKFKNGRTNLFSQSCWASWEIHRHGWFPQSSHLIEKRWRFHNRREKSPLSRLQEPDRKQQRCYQDHRSDWAKSKVPKIRSCFKIIQDQNWDRALRPMHEHRPSCQRWLCWPCCWWWIQSFLPKDDWWLLQIRCWICRRQQDRRS